MSQLVFILGDTGSGKSSSILRNEGLGIKGLNPDNTVLINTVGKNLPVAGWRNHYNKEKENLLNTRNAQEVVAAMKFVSENKPNVKNIVIDDTQYILQGKFMDTIKVKSFDKFNDIAKDAWDIFSTATSIRDDILVFVMSHLQTTMNDFQSKKSFKTVGKAVDNYITPEGLTEIVIYAEGERKSNSVTKYFRTQGDGVSDTCKSPHAMFEFKEPNDLGLIEEKIRKFYGYLQQ